MRMPEEYRVGLRKEQKMGFVLLLIFGILALVLGVVQIRNTMYAPFALTTAIPPFDKEAINDPNSLRFRDTDRDGLNDFDELYIYNTSPYLADTDSDGIRDGQEVSQGSDPNCPKGKECSGANMGVDVPTPTNTISASGFGLEGAIIPREPGSSPSDLAESLENPQMLRQLLLSAGTSKEVLDKVSDAEIMAMVADIMSSSTALNSMEAQLRQSEAATGTAR